MFNIVSIFSDFYFTKYLFGGVGFLGVMYCIRKLVLGK